MYPRNAATPPEIAIGQVVQISDGAIQTTGLTLTVKPSGGVAGSAAGSTAVNADGTVLYTPTQAETNYEAFSVIASKADCLSASQTVVTSANANAGKVQVGGVDADAINAEALGTDAISEIQSGLSQHDAADVWEVAERSLTDKAGFSLTPEQLSAIADEVKSQLDSTHGDGSWETADLTGIPTTTQLNARTLLAAEYATSNSVSGIPQAVWGYGTRTLSSFGTLIADIWSFATRTLSSFGTLVEDIDTELTENHGEGSWQSGSGGSGGVTIAPVVGAVVPRFHDTTLTLFRGEVRSNPITVVDSSGDPVNLSGKTLRLVIEFAEGKDAQVIEDGDITVSGLSLNVVTFTNSAAVTSKPRVMKWALRDVLNGNEVILAGPLNVLDAADKDS